MEVSFMEIINIKDLFKNTDNYIEQTITVGGWLKAIEIPKPLVL